MIGRVQAIRAIDRDHPYIGSAARLDALAAYAVIDTLPEPAFDDVAALAAAICDTPLSTVSFVCADRQWFKARRGLDATETPIAQSFCAHAIAEGGTELFEVRDAAADPRFMDNPLVTAAPGIRYYAGVPLLSREGYGIGALCVIDTEPRPEGLTEIQKQTLRTLSNQVTAQLELRRTMAERDAHAAERQTTADELGWLASHDPLTGLGNRALFQARLQEAVAAATAGRHTTLMILDLDRFKQVNDALGHDAGDSLLRAVADRLRAVVRSTDTVARMGGDEFGIILPGVATREDVARVTAAIFERVQEPILYRGRPIEARLTIGAAIFPDHAIDAADLIRHADIALYSAKAGGRGRSAIFDPTMLRAAQQHACMIDLARSSLAEGSIVPCYQPKVDLRTGRVTGFEALLRIRGAGGRYDPPAAIAAAFDDSELASRLGTAMIRQIAVDMRRWLDDGLEFGRIAVNASACEFRDEEYSSRLLDTLAAAGVPAHRLEIEVTETVLLDRDAVPVERALRTLATAGVRVALDDFGTGYASLTHLDRFPVNVLKIDRSFVAGIRAGSGSSVIVNAILNLADNLGIETVAEGIETHVQADYLRRGGCVIGQGFLYGGAVPAHDVKALIVDGVPAERLAGVTPWAEAA